MTRKNADKQKARHLQREIGKDTLSYQECLNLLRKHGFDEAKRIVAEMTATGDAEIKGIGA